ncbi:Dhap-at [Trypoxylus dichotomus]
MYVRCVVQKIKWKISYFVPKPRRQEISNFLWVSRELSTKVPYKQTRKLKPSELKLAVLNSEKIQILIEKECANKNLSKEQVINEVKHILDEIGYKKQLELIRWLGLVVAKICTQVCSGINVNRISIMKLRTVMGNVPLMYVPSHRSYADFILMSYICFHYDIEIPAIAAGMDFHGMKGMGTVLRNTGAFFMRRSYNDDNLYWDTFREYVHQIVVKSELGIEFFIEGTRSRSGKSLYPKFGLFSMILKAFFNGEVPDILFVPINISYERVMEEKLFAFELLGVPKPKESTSAFFKSLSLIKEKYGNVYVNFGTPISAYQFFGDKIDRSVHCTKPVHLQAATENERKATALLAQSIVKHQQKLCELTWLKMIIEKFGAITDFTNGPDKVFEALQVHCNLLKLCGDGEIKLIRNVEPMDKIDRTKLKGHQLQDEIMTKSLPAITIQLYVNPCLHYLINASLITIVLKKHCQNDGISKDVLFSEYSSLRAIFNKEFVLFRMYEQQEFEASMDVLQEVEVITDDNYIRLRSNEKLQQVLCNLLQPFFVTYYTVCSILRSLEVNEFTDIHIYRTVQRQVEKLLYAEVTIHPYALSLDTISNCLQTLNDVKAIRRIKRNTSTTYAVQTEALSTIIKKLGDYMIYLIPGFNIPVAAKL